MISLPHPALALLLPFGCAALLLYAAARDLASRTIPNRVSLALIAIGVIIQLSDGTLPQALAAAGAVFVVCAIAWRFALMGGGDVKLLAALALCVPPGGVLSLIASVAFAGGALGIAYLILRRLQRLPLAPAPRRAALPARVWRTERWRIGRGSPLPYGIAIAVGGLVTLF